MELGPEADARLQVENQEPFAIAHVVIERDVLRSRLTGVAREDGRAVSLPVGARVTLFKGSAVVFVGRVDQDGSVVDLVSAEAGEDENEFEEI